MDDSKEEVRTLDWDAVRADPSEYRRMVYEEGRQVRIQDANGRVVMNAVAYGGKTGRTWNGG